MFGRYRLGYGLLFGLLLAGPMIAASMSGRSYISFFAPGKFASTKLVVALLPILSWYAMLVFRLARRGVEHPLPIIGRVTMRNRHWLLRSFLLFFLVSTTAGAFPAAKNHIPYVTAFYADPVLIAADKVLFLGVDPWRVTHSLIGPVGTVVLDRFYLLLFPALAWAIVWLCTSRDLCFQLHGLVAMVLVWLLLGVFLATALASVGPVFYSHFYQSDYFQPLTDSLGSLPLRSNAIAEWLLIPRERFGSGITAMPSMHVALSWFFYLMVRARMQSPVLSGAALAFALVTWFASVHLAWHYAVDGLVSIVLTSLIWTSTGVLVRIRNSDFVSDRRGVANVCTDLGTAEVRADRHRA